MKKTLLAAVATFAATSAFAADLPVRYNKAPPPVAVQVFSWTGFYIGGHIGGASARHESAQIADPTDGVDFHDYPGGRETGVFGGVQAGYNWRNGSWVFGIEGDIQATGAEETFAPWKFSNPWFGTVRGRAGYLFDNVLFFGTGGLAFGELRANTFGVSESHTNAGWTLGAGAEMEFAPQWTAKIEYLYVDLANSNFVITGASNGYRFGLIRAGVNYHF